VPFNTLTLSLALFPEERETEDEGEAPAQPAFVAVEQRFLLLLWFYGCANRLRGA
jgi:hypothetical protein